MTSCRIYKNDTLDSLRFSRAPMSLTKTLRLKLLELFFSQSKSYGVARGKMKLYAKRDDPLARAKTLPRPHPSKQTETPVVLLASFTKQETSRSPLCPSY
jgi:hypothetical protein